jgi:hypothetical protein
MDRTSTGTEGRDEFTADQLSTFRQQLALLARETKEYPLECAVGSYDLLFESRDDIEMILDSLAEGSA